MKTGIELWPLFAEVNAVGWGALITALAFGIIRVGAAWYPSWCMKRADELKDNSFTNDSFRISFIAYLPGVLFLGMALLFFRVGLDTSSGRQWVMMTISCFCLLLNLLLFFLLVQIKAEFRNSEFVLKERAWGNEKRVLLKDIQKVTFGQHGIEIHYCDQLLVASSNFSRLPTLIAMLKYYRPDAGS